MNRPRLNQARSGHSSRSPMGGTAGVCCWLIALAAMLIPTIAAAAEAPTAQQIADAVDQHLSGIWERENLQPLPRAEATTFARRLHLDLLGRIPSAAEARDFAAKDSPEHRRQTIIRLTESAASGDRLANLLRQQWFPQTNVDPYRYLATDVQRWLASQLQQRRPLNEIAAELIAVPYANHEQPAGQMQSRGPTVPRTVIEANDHRADQMANNVTAAFLGVHLACAQCHDHPFGRWTQDEFWQTAAFFQRAPSRVADSPLGWSISIPDTDRTVRAALFTGAPLGESTAGYRNGREAFAAWVSGSDNPFFARQVVNQAWAELFGHHLVESLDNSSYTPPAQQALLDELAGMFVATNYNYLRLLQGLTLSRGYQLQSQAKAEPQQVQARCKVFAAARVRGISGAQLYDSIRTAAGLPLLRDDLDPLAKLAERRAFSDALGTDAHQGGKRSIVQSLTVLNGEYTRAIMAYEENSTVAALADAAFLSEDACLEALFWSTLSRPPTEREVARLRQAGLLRDDLASRQQRYSQIFWLLVNTVEFSTNH